MKKLANVLVMISLISLVGCLEYKEQVKLNKDGSGTTQLRFAVSKVYFEQMAEMSQMIAKMGGTESEPMDQSTFISSKEQIEKFLKDVHSGAKLVSYEESETDDFRVWDVSFTFTNLAELDHASASVFQDDEDSSETEHQPTVAFTKQADGRWLFTRNFPEEKMSGATGMMGLGGGETIDEYSGDSEYPDDYPAEEDGEESSVLGTVIEDELGAFTEKIEQAAGDPNKPVFTFSVSFPGKVVESNASSVDGKTATWAFTMEQLSAGMPSMTASVED